MPLCWSYARTSTVRQASADRSGIERQEAALAQWLIDHPGYELVEALVDAGVSAGSGKNRERGALGRFIRGGRSGAVPPGSCLVVESMSRFSREVATATLRTLLNDVWGQGLAISFCTDGVVLSSDLIEREDYRLHGLVGSIGQARREWEERSRRSKGAVRKREELQNRGLRPAGRLPFWIERISSGELVISEVYGPVIERAVDLAIGGLGMTLVAERLNNDGCPPPPTRAANQYRPESCRRWSPGSVSRILASPALIGTLERKNAGALPGYYPASVTLERWDQLRASIDRRNSLKGAIRGKSHKAMNLFQTVMRCGCCGGPIGYTRPAKRSRVGHPGYLACRHGARKVNGCAMSGYIEYDRVEAHCLRRLSAADWELLLHRPEDEQERREGERKAADLSREEGRLRGLLEAAERRAEDAWLTDDEERCRTAERAVRRLRSELQAAEREVLELQQSLARLRALPQSADQAAAMRTRVAEFVSSIQDASGQRVEFNRWLVARQPEIEFRLHLDRDGGEAKTIEAEMEMLVGGRSLGRERVSRWIDKLAIIHGHLQLQKREEIQHVGPDTVVTTVWSDGFDSADAVSDTLRTRAEENRKFAESLRAPGGCLEGAPPAVIGG